MFSVENIRKDNNIGRIDFKDILLENLILVNTEREIFPNLKKWLRYHLFQSQDADNILKKSDVILKLGWYEEQDSSSKKRYLDCIFSMRIHLNMLLKLYNPNSTKYSWLLMYFDEIFNKERIKKFSEKSNIDVEEFERCLRELDRFAKNTNTLGNYMVVPDAKYNSIKGFNKWNYNDRIELLFKDIFSDSVNYRNYRVWFSDKRIHALFLSNLFENVEKKKVVQELLNFKLHKKDKFEVDDIKEFCSYLEYVNKWIENRTNKLISIINEK